MRRIFSLTLLALALAVGVAAQPVLRFTATRIVGHRAVWDTNNQPSPLTAYYIQDEAPDGTTVCTRLLYHQNGHFAVQEMLAVFCGVREER